ncbi:MAG: T9SS type A sorting domain-containing protein [Bacteroidota bacterium]
MKNFLLLLALFSIHNLYGQYNNTFDTPPYLLQSDYTENTDNVCDHNEYSITSDWNFGNCQKLPQNRTGDGAFMMFENDPSEAATGKLFFRDIVTTSQGYHKMKIDVNHRNFSWGGHPLREIPLRLYVDGVFVHQFKVPLQEAWATLDIDVYFTAGSHTFDLRQDFAAAGPDDDFAIDNIIITPIPPVTPTFCDVRAIANPDQLLNGTACVFDFLQIYGNDDAAWIAVERDGHTIGSYLTDGSLEWIDLEDILHSGTELCIGDELKITTAYYDENGVYQECEETIELVCCATNSTIDYHLLNSTIPNSVYLKLYGYNGLPSYIETPHLGSQNTCNDFTSLWCLFESNTPDGNFNLITSSTDPIGFNVTINKDKFYHILNRSSTPCSNECSLITIRPNPANPDQPLVSIDHDFACPDDLSCIPSLNDLADEICDPVFSPRIEYSYLQDLEGNIIIIKCLFLDIVELNLPGVINYDYDIYVDGVLRPNNFICCGADCDLTTLSTLEITVNIDDCDPYVLSLDEISDFITALTFNGAGSVTRTNDSPPTNIKFDNATLSFDAETPQTASIFIYDLTGRVHFTQHNVQIHKGQNTIPVALQNLSYNGVYIISIVGETFNLSRKYVNVR